MQFIITDPKPGKAYYEFLFPEGRHKNKQNQMADE